MKRIVMLALTLPVFLVGCGAPAEDTATFDGQVDLEYTEPTNGTETEGPVTEYHNPYGTNLTVWTITEQGQTCLVASVGSDSVTMECLP